MIILASTGPVISTRRRCRAGAGGDLPVAFADALVSGGEIGHLAGVDAGLAAIRALSSSWRRTFTGRVKLGDEARASWVRMVS